MITLVKLLHSLDQAVISVYNRLEVKLYHNSAMDKSRMEVNTRLRLKQNGMSHKQHSHTHTQSNKYTYEHTVTSHEQHNRSSLFVWIAANFPLNASLRFITTFFFSFFFKENTILVLSLSISHTLVIHKNMLENYKKKTKSKE